MDGKIYGFYIGCYFLIDWEIDIEYIVVIIEGYDSGLCRVFVVMCKVFVIDLLNLILVVFEVNCCGFSGKCGLDVGEWLFFKNCCWFVNCVVEIK